MQVALAELAAAQLDSVAAVKRAYLQSVCGDEDGRDSRSRTARFSKTFERSPGSGSEAVEHSRTFSAPSY